MTESSTSGGFGTALKALRRAADMTLEEVAEAAGVSTSYLSRAENDLVTPSAGWVQLVAVAIGDNMARTAA
jgi:transcriptional regulator with XRE-family HTH domain